MVEPRRRQICCATRGDGAVTCFRRQPWIGSSANTVRVSRRAAELNRDAKAYCDDMAGQFKEVWRALDISLDTLRRWDRDGLIRVERDSANRRVVPRSEIERLSKKADPVRTGDRFSARNRISAVR